MTAHLTQTVYNILLESVMKSYKLSEEEARKKIQQMITEGQNDDRPA
jgi:hypothetical protein